MQNNTSRSDARKPYHKPEAKRFPLRPEEAVLGNCKSVGVTGPGNPGSCRVVGFCTTAGS